jgi:hypothetical protein
MMRVEHVHAPPSPDGSEGLLAIILWDSPPQPTARPSIHFVTDKEQPLQVAAMYHTARKVIPPHTHLCRARVIRQTQEVLILRFGSMRVSFYTSAGEYVCDKVLHSGDVVILLGGGHGIEMISECDFIEVKQGPYDAEHDKYYFNRLQGEGA